MTDVAIRVENLSKLYRIGGKQEKYATLRDTIVDLAAAPYRRVRGLLRGEAASGLSEEIWALKDINFEVKHGEVVGASLICTPRNLFLLTLQLVKTCLLKETQMRNFSINSSSITFYLLQCYHTSDHDQLPLEHNFKY